MRNSKRDQAIGDVLSNFGFAFEFFKATAHAVMARGGTMSHLRRVVKEGTLQKQIAELIVPACSAADRPLGENEYLVPVGYDMPRDKGKLEAEFSKGGVSELFYGNYEWRNHSSCVGIDETPGDRVMLVKHFDRETESEANIAEMDKLGYRPATHLEAYAFGRANPELRRPFWIVALGSFALSDGGRSVAVLRGYGAKRSLDFYWFGSRWSADARFLLVRK